VAPVSPLSYAGDLLCGAFGQPTHFPGWLSPVALLAFTAVLMAGACHFHGRWRAKGL
jgi:hypothetical protein